MQDQKGLFRREREEIERLRELSLARFIYSGAAVEIKSDTLPGEIWIAADRDLAARIRKERPAAAVFAAVEIDMLVRNGAEGETIAAVHAAKRVLGGELTQWKHK